VLYATRHDEKFAWSQFDDTIAEFETKLPMDHEEQLVFMLVVMPDEFSTKLDEFDFLAISAPTTLGRQCS
jgi:hypothetical protein